MAKSTLTHLIQSFKMNAKRYFLWILPIVIIFTLLVKETKASIDYNINCKNAYQNALAFHFDAMDSILHIEEQKNSNNSVIYSIKCISSFLKYASSENDIYLREFEDNRDIALDRFNAESDKNPYKLYIITDLYLQSAFVNALNSSFITALFQFKKAYNSIHVNQDKFPKFDLNRKALGLMNIAIGSIPKNYNWTLSLLNLKGDLKLGNQQLKEFVHICQHNKDYKYLFMESVILYSFTHTNYSNKKDESKLLSAIFSDNNITAGFKNNQLFSFTKISYYQHLKQNEKALKTLVNIQDELEQNPYKIYYLDYMFGESLLFKNDVNAKIYFKKYISKYPGSNYIKSATYKLAIAYLIENDIKSYNAEMQNIKNVGTELLDSDMLAQKAAQKSQIPNISLLRSRLLFDGGYCQMAETILVNAYFNGEIKSQYEYLEYIYRIARIYDELDNFIVAEIYYKMTIEKGKELSFYFAANSALNLAYHYEQQGELLKSKSMYQLCLDLEFDEYQNSITQKAKAGLNRLETYQ